MQHSVTLPAERALRSNSAGRPVHPAVTATEGLVESLVMIDDETEFLRMQAHAEMAIAQALVKRAMRLERTRAEIHRGYVAAESLVATRGAVAG